MQPSPGPATFSGCKRRLTAVPRRENISNNAFSCRSECGTEGTKWNFPFLSPPRTTDGDLGQVTLCLLLPMFPGCHPQPRDSVRCPGGSRLCHQRLWRRKNNFPSTPQSAYLQAPFRFLGHLINAQAYLGRLEALQSDHCNLK